VLAVEQDQAEDEWGDQLKRFGPSPTAGIAAPIASTAGYDLARDMDEQVKAHPPPDLARLPVSSALGRLARCEYGAAAAGALALLNLLGLLYLDKRPLDSLIGSDPNVFVAAQLIAAAIAVGLALLILTRHGLWACEAVLAWTLFELYPPGMRALYGHSLSGKAWRLELTAVILAIVGVTGAWAIRRAGPQKPPAPPSGVLERQDMEG
jgi:hypothetical protein